MTRLRIVGLIITIGLLAQGCSMFPPYAIWEQECYGKAELAKAESTRKIAILEATAKKDSAQALADAEVMRAQGVAKANTIIANSLEGNQGYLHYLWIQALEHSHASLIYIPTEAQLPLTEAGRGK